MNNNITLEVLLQVPNKVLDFGPPMSYPVICAAYTVEKLSLWEHVTEHSFDMYAIRASHMPKARAEGVLYNLSDDEVIKLDKRREVGVNSDRKFLTVFVHLNGQMTKTQAWVYISRKTILEEHFQYSTIMDQVLPASPGIRQPQRVIDPNPLLHNRFCFCPPLHEYGSVGIIEENMRKHVKKRNRRTIRILNWRRFLDDTL